MRVRDRETREVRLEREWVELVTNKKKNISIEKGGL